METITLKQDIIDKLKSAFSVSKAEVDVFFYMLNNSKTFKRVEI